MRLLILGGTAFLGRAIATAARAAGHDVTCLARGVSGRPPAGVRLLVGDRGVDGGMEALAGLSFDAVIDVARQPGHVRRAMSELGTRGGHYVFVSSGSVYAGGSTPGQTEDAPTLPPLVGDVMESMETYGEAKVACEQLVCEAFGESRSTIARVGLIGGPGDPFGRSGYWPWRLRFPSNPERRVAAPDVPELATQVIDVRDLASWLLTAAATACGGVFNVVGPTRRLEDFLACAHGVAGADAQIEWIPVEVLRRHDIHDWMGPRSLPLWIDEAGWEYLGDMSSARARAAGLVTRPLAQTLADELVWEAARPVDQPRQAGLTDEEERTLLSAVGVI